jgi:GNAT superfamily N-acetyltransferase
MTDEPPASAVRPATVDDAPEIVRLARLMFESMGSDVSDPAWEAAGRESVTSRLGADLAAFVVDAPEAPGRLIASCAGTVNRRLPRPGDPAGLVGYVQWVCVEPGARRQGLARQVMTALLSWYEQAGIHRVELHATPMAESLYLSLGFSDEGGRALRRRPRA